VGITYDSTTNLLYVGSYAASASVPCMARVDPVAMVATTICPGPSTQLAAVMPVAMNGTAGFGVVTVVGTDGTFALARIVLFGNSYVMSDSGTWWYLDDTLFAPLPGAGATMHASGALAFVGGRAWNPSISQDTSDVVYTIEIASMTPWDTTWVWSDTIAYSFYGGETFDAMAASADGMHLYVYKSWWNAAAAPGATRGYLVMDLDLDPTTLIAYYGAEQSVTVGALGGLNAHDTSGMAVLADPDSAGQVVFGVVGDFPSGIATFNMGAAPIKSIKLPAGAVAAIVVVLLIAFVCVLPVYLWWRCKRAVKSAGEVVTSVSTQGRVAVVVQNPLGSLNI
jgi:hypothetical protein